MPPFQPTLRIVEEPEGAGRGAFRLALLDEQGREVRTASATLGSLSKLKEEEIRWYLEDYPQFPEEPAPDIARRIERSMAEAGAELFRSLFRTCAARRIWRRIRNTLVSTRVEVRLAASRPSLVPWELLRDPVSNMPLVLQVRAFVYRVEGQCSSEAAPASDVLRILLVTSRPGGANDVPYRSVANRLLQALDGGRLRRCRLDVLRPPTFDRLHQVLSGAMNAGRPYHVVHFDGHGIYEDLNALYPGMPPSAKRGYLVFESASGQQTLVDGQSMGRLLTEARVPFLVLNACRSGRAELSPEPRQGESGTETPALGSLAQEIAEAGLSGIVAMRYNVYVATAAQFIADLYLGLTDGAPLEEAVAAGRRQMAARSVREILHNPLPLEDWLVPVVFAGANGTSLEIASPAAGPQDLGLADREAPELPPPPAVGFIGADEGLLALDRAFDSHGVVLLHGFAGSGKSAMAAEFSRWYLRTGGVQAVLYTSFDRYKPPSDLLAQRERVGDSSVLWIWDDSEGIAGFPSGSESQWTEDERRELRGILVDTTRAGARILLTSRREETPWLGNLPFRILMPYLAMEDRLLMAQALADLETVVPGQVRIGFPNWYPLLRFAKGNPLTLQVVVRHALRQRLGSAVQIRTFLESLRFGKECFEDGDGQRTTSLGASLHHGFAQAFDDRDLRLLALLHFFQSLINVDVVLSMTDPTKAYSLPGLEGWSRDSGIALLDRAAEIGLLRHSLSGYYVIHPMLPWFLRSLLESRHDPQAAARAFTHTMAERSAFLAAAFLQGQSIAIDELRSEESNLLHGWRIALRYGWLSAVPDLLTGVRELYEQTGRHREWTRLVEETVPLFVDPATDLPLPGREAEYNLIVDFRCLAARKAGLHADAERLQAIYLDWLRRRSPASTVTELDEIVQLRNRASALVSQAEALRLLQNLRCVALLEEALELATRIQDRIGMLSCAYNLALAFLTVPAAHDADRAEHWAARALDLCPARDHLRQAKCHKLLALLAQLRFDRLVEASSASEQELQELLESGREHLVQALQLLPADATDDLAETQGLLGDLFARAGMTERSLESYRESLRHREAQGNLAGAAEIRLRMAWILAGTGNSADARRYAKAALRAYESAGPIGATGAAEARDLLHRLR